MNSQTVFNLILTQTLQVSMVALVGWFVWKVFAKDRPFLAHAIWAVVLLKCVTPPVLASPLAVFSSWEAQAKLGDQPTVEPIETAEFNAETVWINAETSFTFRDLPSDVEPIQVEAAEAQPSALSWEAVLVGSWATGAVIALMIAAIRLIRFLRLIKRRAINPTPEIGRILDDLLGRLEMNCTVRIRILDGNIGPAVIGILRPTILLPAVVVEQQPPARIRILMAHELLHVRRGDLRWAFIQVFARCLGWFNPLVWLADAGMTREAERCCDEETIANLKCTPAEYARSLLDVLETKVELRAAPLLPGVRPTGITAKRMERIMRLGQGCHSRRPWWGVAVLVIGSVVALPASAWNPPTAPQENKKEQGDKTTVEEPGKSARGLDSTQAASDPRFQRMTLPAGTTFTFRPALELGSFDVETALSKIQSEKELSKEEAKKMLLSRLGALEQSVVPSPSSLQPPSSEDQSLKVVLDSQQTLQLGGGEPRLKIVNDKLYALASSENLKAIRTVIENVAKFGAKQFEVQVEIFEVPVESLVDLGLNLDVKQAKRDSDQNNGVKLASAESAVNPKSSSGGTSRILEKSKASEWLHRLQARDQQNLVMLSSPKLLASAGQTCSVTTGEDFFFATADSGTARDKSKLLNLFQGLKLNINVQSLVAESNDQDQVNRIAIEFTRSWISGLPDSKEDVGDDSLAIRKPTCISSKVSGVYDLKADDLLIAVQLNNDSTEKPTATLALMKCREVDPSVPVAKSPLPRSADVGVSDQLSEREVEQLQEQFEQEGIKGWKVIDRRMFVPANVNWQRAAELFQDLRNKRSANENRHLRTGLDVIQFAQGTWRGSQAEDRDLQAAKEQQRQVNDALRSIGVRYKIRGPSTKGEEVISLPPPSDDDIVRAYSKREKNAEKARTVASIKKRSLTELVGPGQLAESIGKIKMHHRLYECKLFDAAGGLIEAINVEHYHWHIIPFKSDEGDDDAKTARARFDADGRILYVPQTLGKRRLLNLLQNEMLLEQEAGREETSEDAEVEATSIDASGELEKLRYRPRAVTLESPE